MANSEIINKVKNKIVKELIKDDLIIKIINNEISLEESEKLINSHIFTYHQNPFTLNQTTTFITIQVHIPQPYMSESYTFTKPEIEIWIISHHTRMIIKDIPKVTQNRNDYLSELIDKKFNGRDDFGIGELSLKCNEEGGFQKDYLYRRLIFSTKDLNKSMCHTDE